MMNHEMMNAWLEHEKYLVITHTVILIVYMCNRKQHCSLNFSLNLTRSVLSKITKKIDSCKVLLRAFQNHADHG